MARPPKYNYDIDNFYDEVLALSMKGYTDAEIADAIEDVLGFTLSPEVFCCMKNGNYKGWTEEENERRGQRLSKVLARGRRKTNATVRGAYLSAAIGGKKTKNVVRTYAEVKCPCGGENIKCKKCFGTGKIVSTSKSVIQETENELPPNTQALSTWLYHHDEEWRKSIIDGKKLDLTSNGKTVGQVTIFELPDNGRNKDK